MEPENGPLEDCFPLQPDVVWSFHVDLFQGVHYMVLKPLKQQTNVLRCVEQVFSFACVAWKELGLPARVLELSGILSPVRPKDLKQVIAIKNCLAVSPSRPITWVLALLAWGPTSVPTNNISWWRNQNKQLVLRNCRTS